jgi:hypothetical protein
MPQESQIAHRNVRNTNLPYKSNVSPIETDPCYVSGSQDLLTSIVGTAERRPGFADSVETTPTVFNNLQRLFTWDRFDGTFIEMACDVNASGQAVVYERIVGSDDSFVAIFTDTVPDVFDFVVSNNTVYFSNGHVAKKWTPTAGVTNWGIAVGSVNNATGPNFPGTAASDVSTGNAWANPTNVEAIDSVFSTVTLAAAATSDNLHASNFGFSLPSTTTVTGIEVDVFGFASAPGQIFNVYILNGLGNVVGHRSFPMPTAYSGFTVGGNSDLWGTGSFILNWTTNDFNQTGFGVTCNVTNSTGAAVTYSIDAFQIILYGIGGPSISVSGTAGSFSATVGYQYVFTYGNSQTGHVSSPSPASASTGIFSNKLNVLIGLTASTDPQVNQIHVYRSTDSIATGNTAGAYFELPNSPFPNVTGQVSDNAPDISLNVSSVAPIPGFNDPPTPFFQPVYFSGRVWGFKDNRLFFSGLEEILNGVPEESFPSGVAGNFFNFDQPVQALAVAGSGPNQTLMIFCGGRIYGITGTTLDTFRRFLISDRRGCRNRKCVTTLGGMVAWLDSSMQIWGTDGSSLQEVSLDVRPDFGGFTPEASMTFHTNSTFHWLVVAFPTKMFVFDMDMEQWMPPWSVASSYVFSGETSAGNYDLMLSSGTKALKLSKTARNDDGVTYQPIGRTNLFAVVPDFGKRFSYAAMGVYDEPTRTGYPTMVEIDTNSLPLADVQICSDDDPLNPATAYTSIFTNQVSPEKAYNRYQGTNIVQNVFPLYEPPARWIGLQFKGFNVDDALTFYGIVLAYKSLGGR